MRPQQSLLRLALQRSKTQRICRRRYGSSASLIDTLSRRGLLAQLTCVQRFDLQSITDNVPGRHEQLDKDLQQRKHTVYLGVDPTAKALHVGNLLPFMCLLHFHLRGHKAVALVSVHFACTFHCLTFSSGRWRYGSSWRSVGKVRRAQVAQNFCS